MLVLGFIRGHQVFYFHHHLVFIHLFTDEPVNRLFVRVYV